MESREEEDEDYYLPLQDQRVFGAGIKRKRINFIPASTLETSLPTKTSDKRDIASRYLSIVLPKTADDQSQNILKSADVLSHEQILPQLCPVCGQPITLTTSHESSISHQVCMEHVPPPSHLPRTHIGVRYLTAHGWDPDSRKGLGAREEGITAPIKAREKNNTAGLRETMDEDDRPVRKKKAEIEKESKVVRLDAKQLKARDAQAKVRAEKLRQNFYGPDLEKYLGPEPP